MTYTPESAPLTIRDVTNLIERRAVDLRRHGCRWFFASAIPQSQGRSAQEQIRMMQKNGERVYAEVCSSKMEKSAWAMIASPSAALWR